MSIRTLTALIAAATLSIGGAFAQSHPVDPSKVAPEFREAAEKRAAEQRKLAGCQKDADMHNVLRRDRAKFIVACIER